MKPIISAKDLFDIAKKKLLFFLSEITRRRGLYWHVSAANMMN
jgi:hypothetical protein